MNEKEKWELKKHNLLVDIDARAINGKGIIEPYEMDLSCKVYELLPGVAKRVDCPEREAIKRAFPKGTKFSERNTYKEDRKHMDRNQIEHGKLFGFEARLFLTIEIPAEYAERRFIECTTDDSFKSRLLANHYDDIVKLASYVEKSSHIVIVAARGILDDQGDCCPSLCDYSELGLVNLDSCAQEYILANAIVDEIKHPLDSTFSVSAGSTAPCFPDEKKELRINIARQKVNTPKQLNDW